jgi:hypothetical protein
MGRIWNIVGAGMQEIRRNSDMTASTGSHSNEKFSAADSDENFIRADLN